MSKISTIAPSSSAEIIADPQRFADAIRAGGRLQVLDVNLTALLKLSEAVSAAEADDDEEDSDMFSLRSNKTGCKNVLFASTRGHARHAARVKIAVDPPDVLNAASTKVSMAIHGFAVTGDGSEKLSPRAREQVQQFIEHNRLALLDYWEERIDTAEFLARIQPPA